MIGSINHIAIAVPDIRAAMAQWQARTGAEISDIQTLPEHGCMLPLSGQKTARSNCWSRLMIARLLPNFWKNPDGGMHHICFDGPILLLS